MISRTIPVIANWRLLGGWYAVRLIMAGVVASPIALVLGASGIGHYPEGDSRLFDDAGVLLVEAFRLEADSIAATVRSAAVVTWLFAVASLVPLAVCLVALSTGRRARLREALPGAITALPAFILLAGLTVLAQATVIVLWGAVVTPLVDPLREAWPGPAADGTLAALYALGGLAALAIGVASDLARAVVVLEGANGWSAARRGLAVLVSRPLRVATAWGGPAAGAAALLVVGAMGAAAADVSQPEAWRIGAVLVTHQVVAMGLVLTRALWLNGALELAHRAAHREPGPTEPISASDSAAPGDTPARSDALPDPSSDPVASRGA